MDPISLILGAASLGGGIMSSFGKRKTIDPKWLEQHFGAGAVSDEMVNLFNHVINSPQGQTMLDQAQAQGNQFASNMQQKAAGAGLGAGGGGTSGSSIFATSAADTAGQGLQNQVKSNISALTAPMAENIVNQNRNAAVQSQLMQQQTPTPMQNFGSLLGQAGSLGLQARMSSPAPTAPGATPALQATPQQAGMAREFGGTPPLAAGANQYNRGAGTVSRFRTKLSRYHPRSGNLVQPQSSFQQGMQQMYGMGGTNG